MRLGLSSFSYGSAVSQIGAQAGHRLDLNDLIEMTHHFGLDLLQVGDNLPIHLLPKEELKAAKEKLDAYGIELELGMRGLSVPQVHTYISLADYFQSKLIRIVIDEPGMDEPPFNRCVAALQELAPVLQAHDVQLAVENHDSSPKLLAKMIEAVSSNIIGVCLDTGNSLLVNWSFDQVMDTLLPYTVNVHLKNYTIQRFPHQQGFQIEGTAVNQGVLDVENILERVYEKYPHMHCVFELWTTPGKTAAETCQTEAARVEESISYLKALWKRKFT